MLLGEVVAVEVVGIATKANLAWLQEQGCDWITVRRGKRSEPQRDPDLEFLTRCGLQARAWQISEPDAAEIELCIWSEERQKKEDAIRDGKRKRYEKELARLRAGVSRKHCTKRMDKVLQSVGRLNERCKLVSAHYDVTIEGPAPGKGGQPGNATAVTWRLNAKGLERDARTGS